MDLSGCYAAVIGGMDLYVGRPVVHEPGGGTMRLKDAVAFVTEHAAGRDAWVIKVSGPITAAPNVLDPLDRGGADARELPEPGGEEAGEVAPPRARLRLAVRGRQANRQRDALHRRGRGRVRRLGHLAHDPGDADRTA